MPRAGQEATGDGEGRWRVSDASSMFLAGAVLGFVVGLVTTTLWWRP